MTTWILSALFVTGLVHGGARLPPGAAADRVTLRVDPAIVMSPGTFRATVTLGPHSANRRLILVLDSSEYYRSSTTFLEGDGAPRSHEMLFKQVPAGIYTVSARVERNDGTHIIDQATVHVRH
jgi:hypothetical protein